MSRTPSPTLRTCWNQIGITGDRSCPELPTYIHCRNCPVYSAEGRRLLERNLPEGYLQEWTTLLATTTTQTAPAANDLAFEKRATKANPPLADQAIAVVIFRIKREWLALPAQFFKEITLSSSIHTIPHRSNQILLGLVNIRGELQMCVSLAHLLTLETPPTETSSPGRSISSIAQPRMMVLEREGERWVFPVDEIHGVQRLHFNELKPAPMNVAKSTNTYTKGLISWQDTHVSLLDDELLLYTLTRRLL